VIVGRNVRPLPVTRSQTITVTVSEPRGRPATLYEGHAQQDKHDTAEQVGPGRFAQERCAEDNRHRKNKIR